MNTFTVSKSNGGVFVILNHGLPIDVPSRARRPFCFAQCVKTFKIRCLRGQWDTVSTQTVTLMFPIHLTRYFSYRGV